MAIEIKVPDIGADEVEITEILVKVGDKVEAEQSLITVEGDKASMEVPSPQAGIVKEIKVSVGDKTETGKLIMIFDSAEGAAAAAPAPAEEKKEAAPAAAPAPAPVAAPAGAGEQVKSPMPGNILSVNVNVGDTVAEGQVLMILEAMKMENEISAPQDGTIASVNVRKGDVVNSGDLLITMN